MILGQTTNEKIAYSMICISIIAFLLLDYGSIDGFMFQHMAYMQEFNRLGHVSEIDPVLRIYPLGLSSFYLYGIIISNSTGLPIDHLFFLPLQLIPIILLLLSIFKNLGSSPILGAVLILILATFAWNTSFTFSPHGLGLVLFFLLLLLLIIYWQKGLFMRFGFFITSLLTLVSINFVSYKSTLWAYAFMAYSILIYNLNKDKQKDERNLVDSQRSLLFISVIIMLFFNSFLYSSLIPFKRALDEEDLLSTGVQKFYMLFFKNNNDPLSIYGLYYSPPKLLTLAIGLRQVIFVILALLFICMMIKDHYIKRDSALKIPEIVILSLICVTLTTMFLYNLLGAFDVGTLTYVGLITILYLFARPELRRLLYICIALLCASNVLYQFTVIDNDIATKDSNHFEYLKPGITWCLQHQDHKALLKMEVLTKGYYLKEMIDNNLSFPRDVSYPLIFSPEDILFMIQKNNNVSGDSIFIINYLQSAFSITNWKILRSLEHYKMIIDSNPNLNKIYHSSDMINILYIS